MIETNMQPEKPAAARQTPKHFSAASFKSSNLVPTITSQAKMLIPGVPSRWMGMALLGAATLLAVAAADEPKFVRFSKPQTLSFVELVQLSQNEEPPSSVVNKMDALLRTPSTGALHSCGILEYRTRNRTGFDKNHADQAGSVRQNNR